jgi:AraC-like DNA-binding protein
MNHKYNSSIIIIRVGAAPCTEAIPAMTIVDAPTRHSIPHDVFRAELFPERERFGIWRESVLPLFETRARGPLGPGHFEAWVESYNLQELLFCMSGFSPLSFHRGRHHATPDGGDHLLVQLYLSGGYVGYNGACPVRVGPGDISLLDLGRTLETRAPASNALSLVIPRDRLSPLAGAARLRPGTVLKAGSPLAVILGNHLRTVWRSLPDATLEEAEAINAALVGTVAGAFRGAAPRGDDPGTPLEQATLQAIRDYIHHHLADQRLTPALLCHRFGYSRSRLYRLFEPLGGVAGYIREQRLRRCFEELTRPHGPRSRIVDVALHWGFDSQSHFSRLFRKAFGLTPSEARAGARDQWYQRVTRERAAPAAPAFHEWLCQL